MLDKQEQTNEGVDETQEVTKSTEANLNDSVEAEEIPSEDTEDETTDQVVEKIDNQVAEDAEKSEERNAIPMLAYENMELEELVEQLKHLLKEYPVQQLKTNIDSIKNSFNAKFGALLAEKKAAFLAEGGNSIDFQFSSPIKTAYNTLLSEYKNKRDAYYAALEDRLSNNLELRHQIINELKDLIENADPMTMHKSFLELQNRWREIGPVPRSKYNDTWRNYHHHVERFYDLLHLSNDFRDLDFKHNLEEKLKLIARVESLIEHEDVNEAFKELQEIHKTWKEDVGPVSKEHREEVWQKFSDASKKIHDRRHQYFRELRSKYQEVIDKKNEIIAKIAAYDTSKNAKHSDWQKSIKEIEALREEYFNAGKLPYSKSEQVWVKFKDATKKFNKAKNDFYKKEKSVQQENLDKKYALIEIAESVKDSDDWEATTNTVKKIQAEWKQIGHVPRKFSDDVWKKFKAACNHYFDRFHNRQNDLNKEQQAFIDEKKAYLEEVKEIKTATLDEIKEMTQKWRALGDLPRSVRHLESKFNKHMDSLLDGLGMDKEAIELLKFKNLIDGYAAQSDVKKLNSEQLFVKKKVDEFQKEIQQLENNLSFFSNASEDNPMIVKVRKSIEGYKEDMKIWESKLDMIRRLDY
ncbi:hypothetical protein GCM10011416_19740 [Polaribacter pacificus]|uniref:Chromosome segregation protein n=1 Tax=Polaribacter pacificus TaxID=1775173 RepID=A0A917I184_9FLAO|nr:DUF349 domain-containing protein [Polaribacter pacificus]GGH01116.1 hypothetical protein GCM10011416_19740 [Polaribacter pacificus]